MSQPDNTFLPDTPRNLVDIDGQSNSGLGDQYGDRDVCTDLLLKLQRTEERDISVLQEELYKDEIKENYKPNALFSEQTPKRIDSVLIKRSSLISKDILKSKNNCFVCNSEFADEFAPDSDVRYYSPDITKKNKKKRDNHFIPNLPTIKSGYSKYFPVVCLQNCNQVNRSDKVSCSSSDNQNYHPIHSIPSKRRTHINISSLIWISVVNITHLFKEFFLYELPISLILYSIAFLLLPEQ